MERRFVKALCGNKQRHKSWKSVMQLDDCEKKRQTQIKSSGWWVKTSRWRGWRFSGGKDEEDKRNARKLLTNQRNNLALLAAVFALSLRRNREQSASLRVLTQLCVAEQVKRRHLRKIRGSVARAPKKPLPRLPDGNRSRKCQELPKRFGALNAKLTSPSKWSNKSSREPKERFALTFSLLIYIALRRATFEWWRTINKAIAQRAPAFCVIFVQSEVNNLPSSSSSSSSSCRCCVGDSWTRSVFHLRLPDRKPVVVMFRECLLPCEAP